MTTDVLLWGQDWLNRLLNHCSFAEGSDRQQAVLQLRELGIPTRQDEAWKYTDLTGLINQAFELADSVGFEPNLRDLSERFTWPEAKIRITLVNGRLDRTLSNLAHLPAGIQIESVSEAQSTWDQPDTWSLLNRACSPEVLRIDIGSHQLIEHPIHVLCLTYSETGFVVSLPRIQVIAGTGSKVTLIEDHHNLKTPINLSNTITEIKLEPNANLTHILLHGDSQESYFINQTAVRQERDSRYINHTVQGGSILTRHSLHISQQGSQAETILNELSLLKGKQQADSYSVIDHQAPYGSSQQHHKCVAEDHSRGTFNGRLRVRQAAQKTDASQSSRNLLLSEKARIYTRPQLEIVADDVKCAHGATISQLDDNELFYLRSRGIPPILARQLLTYGFVVELIDRIPVASIRESIKAHQSKHPISEPSLEP